MGTQMDIVETDVLIVGAGPAGGGMSALLATYGIDNIVINKYGSVSPTPRAHITNQRAMEILRDLGLEEDAIGVSVPQEFMGEHVYCRSLAGEELGRILTWHNHPESKAAHDLASPTAVCDIPQNYLEPIILKAAADRGAKLRFNTEYKSLVQDEDGVTAEVYDRLNNNTYHIRAKYLIGADGGSSKIAQDIGLPLEGMMGHHGSMNIHFKADLSKYVKHRPGDMYWIFQPGTGVGGASVGVLRMVRPWNDWVAVWGYDINEGVPELTEEGVTKIVHDLIGDNSIELELGTFNTWTINNVHASENTRGRVFCMGDAVHRHPPMNGLGSNTSIADAYNLAWKITAVLKGYATPELLKSYQQERVPVGEQIVKCAFENMSLMSPIMQSFGLSDVATPEAMDQAVSALKLSDPKGAAQRVALRKAMDGSKRAFNALGIELNQRYDSCAIASDGAGINNFSRDRILYYEATTQPGAHLPHGWLLKDQKRISTLDLCGQGRFTILTGLGGEAWVETAKKISHDIGVPITVHIIGPGCEYQDGYGDFAALREVQENGALLVRPDMFIGWRAETVEGASGLEAAMKQILGYNT